MNLWRVTDQGKIHTKVWGKVKVGVHTMFRGCMHVGTQLFIMKNWGLGYVMLLAAHAFLSVMFLRFNIFSALLLKVPLNSNFLGSQSVKNNYKKYASSNIFIGILYLYIREVILYLIFKKLFQYLEEVFKTCKDMLYFFKSTLSNNAGTCVF